MRAYGDEILVIAVTGVLMLAVGVAGRGVVIALIRFGWLS